MEYVLMKLAILLFIFVISSVSSDAYIKYFDKAIQNIALNKDNIYIGGVNSIWKLDFNLKTLKEQSTGPKPDNPESCWLNKKDDVECIGSDTKKEVDNYNQILLITNKAGESGSLLTCGTLYLGICEYRSLDTLEINPQFEEDLIFEYVSATLPNATTVAVPSKNGQILYVARTVSYYDSFIKKTLLTITARKLLEDGKSANLEPHNIDNQKDEIDSKKDYFKELKGSLGRRFESYYPIYYTSAHSYDRGVYFTTIQRQNVSLPGTFLSKLIRITPDDEGRRKFKRYVESVVACQRDDISYNILLSISIVDIDRVHAELEDYKRGDKIVFGVFAQSNTYKAYPHEYAKYAICQFSLNTINKMFDRIIESCVSGPAVPSVPWIDAKSCKSVLFSKVWSYAPNDIVYGTVLHTSDKLKYQTLYAYEHPRGISLFVSSDGHSLSKFAVVKENDVYKLQQYSKKVFAEDRKDQSMFFKMVLDRNLTSLILIAKHHIAKVPVVDCSSRGSCEDCLRGPLCGWCSLLNRCTLKEKCPNSTKPLHFVSEGVNACPTSIIKHADYSVEEDAVITLVTTNIPVDVSTYQCQIGTAYIPLARNGSIFTCESFDFKDISTLDGTRVEETVQVSIASKVNGKFHPVVTSTITIYRCQSFKTCDKCITGKYQCGWCANQMTCRKAGDDCSNWIPYKGYESDESSQVCPRLRNTHNKLLPSGVAREVVVNVERFPEPTDGKSYKCLLNIIDAKITITSDSEWKNSSLLFCKKNMYSFPDSTDADSMEGTLTVSYGDAFVETSAIKVLLYKCHMKRYCSLCMNAFEGNCGWCGKPQECRLNETCGLSVAVTNCPNPVINKFIPSKASVNATTELIIKGDDLGARGDLKSVTVAGNKCKHLTDKLIEFEQITCKINPVKMVLSGYINVSLSLNGVPLIATSKTKFHFVKPEVKDIDPKRGACSGGTILTIKGNHLDAGNNVTVHVGTYECVVFGERNAQNFTCKTQSAADSCRAIQSRRRRDAGNYLNICVQFGENRVCASDGFQYQLDPLINGIYTNKESVRITTFFSGGQIFNIEGLRLDLIQNPKFIFTTRNGNATRRFESTCSREKGKDDLMRCIAPNISSAFTGNEKNATVTLGFKMGNMVKLLEYKKFPVVSDPVFYPFIPDREKLSDFSNLDLNIKASGLSVLSKKDVRVEIAGKACQDVGFVGADRLICTMPPKDVLDEVAQGGIYNVKVIVGEGGLEYDIGFVKYHIDVAGENYTLYLSLAAAAGVVVILIVIVSVCVLYRRRHLRDKKDYHKDLQLRMDKIESQYARECKEAFAEYQIERSDLTCDVKQEFAPCREFRQFAMRVLYPGLESHPILESNKDDREEWERCMQSFIGLLKDKDFILTFVRTLEGQSTFQMTDRCIVASLLMVSLQDDIVFVTEILQELLTDLINKAGSGKRPKLLLRRTESIAEKLLTNWLAYTLFDFLSDVVGDPLFSLFTAVNILLDREPADAITFDAKNSLSEDKLLRTKIDFKIIPINIEYVHPEFGGVYDAIPVLSTDTITQCKEKIIKSIYKNQPHSRRPLPDDLQLVHVGATGANRYMQDCDASNVIEGEWKKLNSLGYVLNLHKIPESAVLRLSHSEALSANGSAMMDDSLPNVTFHSSISSTPMLYDSGAQEPKLYHLVKPSDSDFAKDDVRQSKMMAEVYLTRLLKTKETLLSFVNQLFEAIFGLSDYGRVIPPSIKFLFDFLDNQAEKMAIDDTDVHHTWKNNSLPLRFWINIIKNPDFVFDIRKSNTVDSCLSVIAQLFMDSCSPDEHRLGKDSPSNKLLYAKEIPGYKKQVKKFYKDVKEAEFEEKEFYGKLEEISTLYGQSFNSCNAAYELMSYAVKYKVKLMDNLEDNDSAEDAEKLQEIMENLPDD